MWTFKGKHNAENTQRHANIHTQYFKEKKTLHLPISRFFSIEKTKGEERLLWYCDIIVFSDNRPIAKIS